MTSMQPIQARQRTLLVIATTFAVLCVVFFAAQANGLGRHFFDEVGQDKDSCDIWYPMLAMDDTTTGREMCTAGPPQDEAVLLWSGQTEQVNFPVDPDFRDYSIPTIKARAYYHDLPVTATGAVNTAAMSAGAATIEIRGADMCVDPGGSRYDRIDWVRYGYFESNYAKFMALRGQDVTRYTIGSATNGGSLTRHGVIRFGEAQCSPSGNILTFDLKNLAPSLFVPVPGIARTWSVDITVRHKDLSDPDGYERTPLDGLVNGFGLAQGGDCGCHGGISTAGTGAQRNSTWDPAEGYVATIKRGVRDSQGNSAAVPTTSASEVRTDYATFVTRFGSDCSVAYQGTSISDINSNAPRYRMLFFDLDYENNPFPTQTRIRVQDETNGAWLWPGGSNASDGTDANITFSNNPGPNRIPGLPASLDVRGNDGVWRANPPNYRQSILPNYGDLKYFVVTFPATRDHNYRLEILNVWDRLVTQYSVPFDSIYYDRDCSAGAGVTLSFTTESVSSGQSATAIGTIRNSGDQPMNLRFRQTMWFDDDNNETERYLGEPLATPRMNWTTKPGSSVFAPGETYPYTTSAPANPAHRYICAMIEIEKINPADIGILLPDFATRCIPIAVSPDFYIAKGDLRAGGVYSSGLSCSVAYDPSDPNMFRIHGRSYTSPTTKGSRVEYGIFTPGRITNVGSNNLPYGYSTSAYADKLLLFASQRYSPAYSANGHFWGDTAGSKNTFCLSNIERAYGGIASLAGVRGPAATSAAAANITAAGVYQVNNDTPTVNICAGGCTLAPGERRVIHIQRVAGSTNNKTVRIAGNIQMPASVASIRDVPQFVLILDDNIDLQFAENVTRFDGIIASKGNIYTCENKSSAQMILANQCSQQLRINGAVISDGEVLPYRTPTEGEVFTLTPEVLIGDFYRAQSEPVITTLDQYERPPRF